MKQRGFSLLEMVVVLAIFAVVALIGVQVIRATLQADSRLAAVSDANSELTVALALLRQDLNAGIALVYYPETGGSEPALKVFPGAQGFALSIGGMAGANATPTAGLGRVIWRLDAGTGRLLRQVVLSLAPGSRATVGPEVAMLSGVNALSLSSFDATRGWARGFAPDLRDPNLLPDAVRVRLDTQRFQSIDTVVKLR